MLVPVPRQTCWAEEKKPAPWAPAVCYSSLFVGRLLYGRWHFCDGHQGARDLIQQLIGIFLFSQRLGEQRDDRAVTQLLGEIFRRRITGDLIVLNSLSWRGSPRCYSDWRGAAQPLCREVREIRNGPPKRTVAVGD